MSFADPEGAVEDMRLARSYLEDWEKKKGAINVLSLAAKYIEQARSKDPDAKLVITTKEDSITFSQDDLAGIVLFYESQQYAGPNADKKSLKRARDTLNKALAYKPYSIQYRELLADVLLDLHDKDGALAVANEAVKQNRTDLNARKLLDRIQAAPVTHAPTFIGANPGCAAAIIGSLFIVCGIIALFNAAFSSAIWLILFGAAAFGIGRFFESDQTLRKAMDDQQRKRADKDGR